MLRKNGSTICRPSEAISMLDRTDEADRLLAYAVEHLMFSHPYKKFDLVISDSAAKGFHVYDFEERVCQIGLYRPDGEERTALQLEFKYNYHVHNKAPKDAKRTSNINKILDCVKLIKPTVIRDHKDLLRKKTIGLVEETTKYSAAKREFDRVFSSIAYDRVETNISLFEDLLNKRDTSAVDALRNKFYSRHQEYVAAAEHKMRLCRNSVMVTKNHSGDYRVIHRLTSPAEDDPGAVRATYDMVTYPEKEKIPPNIYGKLCLLEIAEQNEESTHSIEGVGHIDKNYKVAPVYIIIGEDLEEPAIDVDARTKGEVEGN